MSGKGGAGKSLAASLPAILAQQSGKRAAILEADITGPSIPKVFGISGRVQGDERGIIPAETSAGIELMSLNLLLERPVTCFLRAALSMDFRGNSWKTRQHRLFHWAPRKNS